MTDLTATRRKIPAAALALLSAVLLPACTSMPAGPSMMALPGAGRSFEQFRHDDYACRQFADQQTGGMAPNRASVSSGIGSAAVAAALGAAAGAAFGGGRGAAVGAGTGLLLGGLAGTHSASASGHASQQRYDMGYTQCMYAKGHQVPVSGQIRGGSYRNGSPYPGMRSPDMAYPSRPFAGNTRGGSLLPPPPPPGTPPPPPPR